MMSRNELDGGNIMNTINLSQVEKRGFPFRYHILTYGCQMNEHDSEIIAGLLENMGYTPSNQLEDADLIIVNTCCVRESAEEKIYGKIGSLKALKMVNPDLVVGVSGCMAQKPDESKIIRKRAPFVDFIIGTDTMQELRGVLTKVYQDRLPTVCISTDEYRRIADRLPRARSERHKAWVTIMHGCNNFCSYCIVPFVRGRERSRTPESIIAEVIDLVGDGVKEITLLGQNVNSYGQGLSEENDFSDLLRKIDRIDGIERIRFMTSHPKDLSAKLMNVMGSGKHICHHIHLPVQAGSNQVLKSMNRGYTREDYLELVKSIRETLPGCSITTDIIVGFPGESDDNFEDTLDLVRQIRWNAAYTFLYSNRSGTKAAQMSQQIADQTKKVRLQKLMALQNVISLQYHQEQVGRTVEVMIDGESRTNPDVWSSRTATNELVLFPKIRALSSQGPGDRVQVRIVEGKTWTLHGQAEI